MLNLLISIIGDSYGKIMSLNRNNLNFERASILLEIDISIGENRLQYLKKYLFVSNCSQEDALEDKNSLLKLRDVTENIK